MITGREKITRLHAINDVCERMKITRYEICIMTRLKCTIDKMTAMRKKKMLARGQPTSRAALRITCKIMK